MGKAWLCLLVFLTHLEIHGITTVKIDGSSTVYPITEAVAEEFQLSVKGQTRVIVGISGTGGGFKKFCRGETHVQNASRPISENEMEACRKTGVKYIELPIAYDSIVIAVNPQNTWLNEITVDVLKKIWEPAADKKIKRWNQIDPSWPDEEIKLYGAGTDSGTFDYFTEAVMGRPKASRTDYTASEDDNTLVTGISKDKYALGYLPLSYYGENQTKIKAVGIIGGPKSPMKEKAVFPSRETVEKGIYFPLSRPVFIYVSEEAIKNPDIRKFVEFYLTQAAPLVTEVKYVALPAAAYEIGKDHLKKGKVGTTYGGHPSIGMKVEEVMQKEGKL